MDFRRCRHSILRLIAITGESDLTYMAPQTIS